MIGHGVHGLFTERCGSAEQKRLYQPSDVAHISNEVHLNLSDNCINKSPDNLLVRSAEAGMPSCDSTACKQAPSRGTSHLSQAAYSLTSVASPWLHAHGGFVELPHVIETKVTP